MLLPDVMKTKLVGMRNLLLLVAVGAFLQTIGCKSKPAEGPAERAGKKLDEAAQDTKDAVKRAGHDVDNATKKP